MEQSTEPRPEAPYFVQGSAEPHETLLAARQEAARLQYLGRHESIPILQNGQIVDCKRF